MASKWKNYEKFKWHQWVLMRNKHISRDEYDRRVSEYIKQRR